MKIGKKLYVGFGAVLAVLVLLFVVNLFAGLRERSARLDASAALENVRTIESVRYQIMLNRLNLNNYLLSGDPRDEEKVNKGLVDIADAIKRGQAQGGSDNLKSALTQVESTEAGCITGTLHKIERTRVRIIDAAIRPGNVTAWSAQIPFEVRLRAKNLVF